MDNEGKRKIVEYVGLIQCDCNKRNCNPYHYLDPTKPADMEKIWKAFRVSPQYDGFRRVVEGWSTCDIMDVLTSAPDLAEALLEYIEQKEGE